MRMRELSTASGVPVPTIKYYLREGLLPAGERTAPNQAEYGDLHERRLHLIRVLSEVGALQVADIRRVLKAIDVEHLTLHEVLGVANHALGSPPRDATLTDAGAGTAAVDDLLDRCGWQVSATAPARAGLAAAISSLARLGYPPEPEHLDHLAGLMSQVAQAEAATVRQDRPREEIVEYMVIGTVVYEAMLSAMRRLALEHHSARRFGEEAG